MGPTGGPRVVIIRPGGPGHVRSLRGAAWEAV